MDKAKLATESMRGVLTRLLWQSAGRRARGESSQSSGSLFAIFPYGMQLLLLRRVRLLLKLVGVRVARRIGVFCYRLRGGSFLFL